MTNDSIPSYLDSSNRNSFQVEIEGQSHKQVEGFMKNNNILPPPESCASSMSLPITTFEDA